MFGKKNEQAKMTAVVANPVRRESVIRRGASSLALSRPEAPRVCPNTIAIAVPSDIYSTDAVSKNALEMLSAGTTSVPHAE